MLASGYGSSASEPVLASSASSLRAPSGPRYPARGWADGISGRRAGAILGHGAAGREPHGLGLLRGELQFAPPVAHLLAVDARLIAMVDAREHDPRAFVVEQRDRHRLLSRELVVGVVAHERAVRDRPAQPALGAGEAIV